MNTDAIFKAAATRKNKFTAAEIAGDLEVDKDLMVKALKNLKVLGAAECIDGSWTLTMRRTAARDAAVLVALSKMGDTTRAELNTLLPDNTSAQVYTSLQRLILRGQVKQSRDGSRTPRYVSVTD